MAGDGCRAELFEERHRDALKAACAEDREIWEIYANNFGPAGFDDSIDRYVANPNNRTFVLLDGDELAGMSSFLGIDEGRQVLEIGGTYYRPHLRGTGFNRRVKALMLAPAFGCGIRRVEFRVRRRPPPPPRDRPGTPPRPCAGAPRRVDFGAAPRTARPKAAMKKLGAVRE